MKFMIYKILFIATFSFLSVISNGQSQIGSDIDGERAGDNSGIVSAISGDGNTIIIGAPKNYGSQVQGTTPGHLRVLKKINGKWIQKGSDIEGVSNDCLGASVIISRNAEVIAVGAPCRGNGYVRVFKFSSNKWTQIGGDIIGESFSDKFGCSISLSDSGNFIAIGAYANDGNSGFSGDERGHVRVFENTNNSWSQIGSDIDGEMSGDFSGTSVSLSGNGSILSVGSPRNAVNGNSRYGQVRVFQYSSNQWNPKGKWLYGEGIGDYFGWSVSLNFEGNKLAIGAPYNDATGSIFNGDYGHVRIFAFKDSSWNQIGNDIDGEAASDNFGWSVSLNDQGDLVAAGAPNNDGSGVNAGHTRLFNWDSKAWAQLKNDIDGESAGDQSGYSVSISSSGSTVAIGAPYNDGTGNDAGHVRVYVTCNIRYSVDSVVACQSYKWTNGIIYTKDNNSATDTFINVEGCDSIVTLKLTINQHSKSTVIQKACDFFLSPNKKSWAKTGIFNDTIRNWCGCDSVISYSLIITKIDSLIKQQPVDQTSPINGEARFIIKSSFPDAQFQWQSDIGFGFVSLSNATQYSNVNTDTLSVTSISQSNNQQLFRCIVGRSGCFDTTQNVKLKVSANSHTNEISERFFSISPNPNSGSLLLISSNNVIGLPFSIIDVNGKIAHQGYIHGVNSSISLDNLKDGIYLLKVGKYHELFMLTR